MLKHGVLNPQINSLLARVRHVYDIDERRIRLRDAVDGQNAEVQLMDMEGVKLASPILDRPLLVTRSKNGANQYGHSATNPA